MKHINQILDDSSFRHENLMWAAFFNIPRPDNYAKIVENECKEIENFVNAEKKRIKNGAR